MKRPIAAVLLTLVPLFWAVPSHADETNRALFALFDEEWEYRLREDPLLATAVGRHEADHLLPSLTLADLKRRHETDRAFLRRLRQIDREALGETDRVHFDIFERQLTMRIEEFEIRHYRLPLTVDSGFHIGFARLPSEMPFTSAEDYRRYIDRLRAFPDYVAQHIVLMREGLATGMTLPKIVLEGYEVTIDSHVVDNAEKSLFFTPFSNIPSQIPAATRARLRDQGEAAILEAVVGGYRTFLEFMTEEYIPGARETLGASELPDGAAYYNQRIRNFTTLDLDANEIHRIGLEEVRRIKADMEAVIKEVGFAGDFQEFLHFLRTDSRFYASTPEELLKEASFIAKRMDAKLPSLFKTLPRQPYGVAPVPDHLAPKYTTGRYVGAAPGSTQPGYYWVNTYALESRPLYVLTALSLHEAVPGHHLQVALAQELEGVPDFRRYSYISAFGEGWGLYSEWLGIEAGLYDDPYEEFGRLTYEMWRACRLVVDTGIHAMGWSRQQALDYLADHTALSLHEVTTETDRYISWPAQALAYKLGELKIRELRKEAETALEEDFDIREFHDAVLGNGSIPLAVLEDIIHRFITDRQRNS